MRSQNITCDIYTQKADTIHYVQGEKGREIKFSFINSATSDNIDLTGLTVTIHILKSDGNFTIDNLTHGSEYATYTLTENDCIVGGMGVYDLSISDADTIIYTAHGEYIGDNKAVADGTVNSVSIAYGVPFPEGFQEKLIPGANITIVDNVISSTGGGGGADDITASASIDANTGTPSVVVTKTTSGDDINFDFAFHNLKGTQGNPGTPGADGADGRDGTDGVTPVISATASVDNNTGTPGVTVTKSGTDSAPSFAFDFVNIKGAQGAPGADGHDGTDGVGVPTGGTAGQVLAKIDSTDYNTEWVTPSGGGRPFSATDIYINQTSSNENTITLTTTYQDFDEVRILVKENVSDIYYPEQIISKSELDIALNDQTNVSMTPYFFSGSYYCYYKVTSTTTLVLQSQAGAFHIRKIIGIKYGNGVGTDEAINVNYDNTTSGLTATNVQYAIDENANNINTLNSKLSNHITGTTFAELNTAVSALTDAQYFSSNIVFWSSGIGYNLMPTRGDARVWALILAGSASYMSRMYQFVINGTSLPMTQKENNSTISTTPVSVDSWDLYYIG